jgi:hypothetical protein
MRVCIQQTRGEFPNITYYNAWLGFRELGYDAVLIDEAGFADEEFGEDALPVGQIPLMLAIFTQCGIAYSHLDYVPREVMPFAARRIWTSTLGEAREVVARGDMLFVKPSEGTPRRFKGQVLRTFRDLIRTASCDASMPVWCSELVDFVSEYRVYVCEREIVGIKHYSGDFRIFVDPKTIDAALLAYTTQPSGFGIDFGVTRDGRTLIVEQNDGFSLGSYGLHPVTYAKLLETRWLELLSGRPLKDTVAVN